MVHVSPTDGCCRECGGPLRITDADDATMQVACETCGDEYSVEPDAFGDGGIEYWPAIMAELEPAGVPGVPHFYKCGVFLLLFWRRKCRVLHWEPGANVL